MSYRKSGIGLYSHKFDSFQEYDDENIQDIESQKQIPQMQVQKNNFFEQKNPSQQKSDSKDGKKKIKTITIKRNKNDIKHEDKNQFNQEDDLRQNLNFSQGAPVNLVQFSPDGKFFSTVSFSKQTIMVFQTNDQQLVSLIDDFEKAFLKMAISNSGDIVATTHYDKTIQVTDLTQVNDPNKHRFDLKGHHDLIESIIFTKNNKRIISGGNDKYVIIWSIRDRQIIQKLQMLQASIFALDINENSTHMAVSSGYIIYGKRNFENEENEQQQQDEEDQKFNLKKRVSSQRKKNTILKKREKLEKDEPDKLIPQVYIYQMEGGQISIESEIKKRIIQDQQNIINCIRFSPKSGRMLATGGQDNEIRVYNVNTGEQISYITRDHKFRINQIMFSPFYRNRIYTVGDDIKINVYNIENKIGQLSNIKLPRLHTQEIKSISIHPWQDQYIVTGSKDTSFSVLKMENIEIQNDVNQTEWSEDDENYKDQSQQGSPGISQQQQNNQSSSQYQNQFSSKQNTKNAYTREQIDYIDENENQNQTNILEDRSPLSPKSYDTNYKKYQKAKKDVEVIDVKTNKQQFQKFNKNQLQNKDLYSQESIYEQESPKYNQGTYVYKDLVLEDEDDDENKKNQDKKRKKKKKTQRQRAAERERQRMLEQQKLQNLSPEEILNLQLLQNEEALFKIKQLCDINDDIKFKMLIATDNKVKETDKFQMVDYLSLTQSQIDKLVYKEYRDKQKKQMFKVKKIIRKYQYDRGYLEEQQQTSKQDKKFQKQWEDAQNMKQFEDYQKYLNLLMYFNMFLLIFVLKLQFPGTYRDFKKNDQVVWLSEYRPKKRIALDKNNTLFPSQIQYQIQIISLVLAILSIVVIFCLQVSLKFLGLRKNNYKLYIWYKQFKQLGILLILMLFTSFVTSLLSLNVLLVLIRPFNCLLPSEQQILDEEQNWLQYPQKQCSTFEFVTFNFMLVIVFLVFMYLSGYVIYKSDRMKFKYQIFTNLVNERVLKATDNYKEIYPEYLCQNEEEQLYLWLQTLNLQEYFEPFLEHQINLKLLYYFRLQGDLLEHLFKKFRIIQKSVQDKIKESLIDPKLFSIYEFNEESYSDYESDQEEQEDQEKLNEIQDQNFKNQQDQNEDDKYEQHRNMMNEEEIKQNEQEKIMNEQIDKTFQAMAEKQKKLNEKNKKNNKNLNKVENINEDTTQNTNQNEGDQTTKNKPKKKKKKKKDKNLQQQQKQQESL